MTDSSRNKPSYPKSHLLAASGVLATLCLSLLIFPSSQVEAKRTTLPFGFEERSLSTLDELAENDADTDEEVTAHSVQVTKQTEPAKQASPAHLSLAAQRGDTLSTLFQRAGLDSSTLHRVLASDREAGKRLTRIRLGQVFEFHLDEQGALKSLHTRMNSLESIEVLREQDSFRIKHDKLTPSIRQAYARATITSSLAAAVNKAGMPAAITYALAEAFVYDIDFALDIRKGDEFEVIYEQKVVEGKVVGHGKILAARFTNRGKTYSAIRYSTTTGSSQYYTADGRSMRKAFNRNPIDSARISSKFNPNRRHPVLNKIRAHNGVDYAAPTGTPIKATGDGRVVLAGRKGGYGNTVIIQHGNSYRTLYAHMHGFAKNIRTGQTVKQGQVIGYVGSTGLSTGPHLHYEFQEKGRHIDPLSKKLPVADPLSGKERQRFLQHTQPLLARMDRERSSMLALNKR